MKSLNQKCPECGGPAGCIDTRKRKSDGQARRVFRCKNEECCEVFTTGARIPYQPRTTSKGTSWLELSR